MKNSEVSNTQRENILKIEGWTTWRHYKIFKKHLTKLKKGEVRECRKKIENEDPSALECFCILC